MKDRTAVHTSARDTDIVLTHAEFDLAREAPDVFATLLRQTPEVGRTFESLWTAIPRPLNALAAVDGRCYRLPNHNRSFCWAIAESRSLADSPAVVVKGSEPLLSDFPRLLDWMRQAPLRRSTRVMADHFPLSEGKIPGALSLKEAIREAQIALRVQQSHLAHYTELAKLPIPLLVYSLTRERTAQTSAILQDQLSSAAFERVAPLLESGLGVYIYYYPSPPVRANYLSDLGTPQFRQFVPKPFDEARTIEAWANLLMRLLYVGYLPYSLRNEGLGACMDFGNAALDGGFCDPDSITPIDGSVDDELLLESVVQTIRIFRNTVERLLGFTDARTLYANIESFACGQYVDHLLRKAIVSEARPSLSLDGRVVKLIAPASVDDVKLCGRRKNRIAQYTHFAKRLGQAAPAVQESYP